MAAAMRSNWAFGMKRGLRSGIGGISPVMISGQGGERFFGQLALPDVLLEVHEILDDVFACDSRKRVEFGMLLGQPPDEVIQCRPAPLGRPPRARQQACSH